MRSSRQSEFSTESGESKHHADAAPADSFRPDAAPVNDCFRLGAVDRLAHPTVGSCRYRTLGDGGRRAIEIGRERTLHTDLMRPIFLQTITVLSNAFRRLEEQVPPPQLVPFRDGFVFRFVEQTLQQALLLKLARVITGLRAVDVLLEAGLLQEAAATCRMLDEIGEDVAFLAAPLTNDRVTELHERYLRGFWAEEFVEGNNTLARHEKPDTPRRNKIQAYVQRVLNPSDNPSRISDVSQALSSTYSGYIHASAVQVLDMYGGDPARFHIEGMRGTPRMGGHIHDAWNYFYRAIVTAIVVARAFGDPPLSRALGEYHDEFLEQSGTRAEGVRRIDGSEPPIRTDR